MQVQWFPGHMAKTMRLVKEQLKSVDIVIEVCDARAPISSRNNELSAVLGEKKRIVVFSANQNEKDALSQSKPDSKKGRNNPSTHYHKPAPKQNPKTNKAVTPPEKPKPHFHQPKIVNAKH